MALNTDQQQALRRICNWYRGNEMYFLLDGAGGTGKSYLVNEVLKNIKSIPLLLSPTNEALKQLKDKTEGDYEFRTIHSALGLAPTTTEKDIKFEHIAIPSLWDDFNLAVVDEVSMVDNWAIELLISIGIKILYLGHGSQLPPVKTNLSVFDKCVSPVFEKGYPTTKLTIPMRNVGKLWEFNNLIEETIYSKDRRIPNDFDIDRANMLQYLDSPQGKDELLHGETKIVLYTNGGVDRYNNIVRDKLFGSSAKSKYLSGDKVILIQPLTEINELERYSDLALKRAMNKEHAKHYANTKAEVYSCKEVVIKLNNSLHIPCYKIEVKTDEGMSQFYECIDSNDYLKISTYYEHLAWGKHTKKDKDKAYKEKHFILSCFANIKHYYAATAHRLQGASIPKVKVIFNDIAKCGNPILKQKLLYVACSRAINDLGIYRGML